MNQVMQNIGNYAGFVQQLRKDPAHIRAEMVLVTYDIVHMYIGMMTEFVELLDGAANDNIDNINEEFGDFMFYLIGFMNATQMDPVKLVWDVVQYSHTPIDEAEVFAHLHGALTPIGDAVKRLYAYNKTLPTDEVTRHIIVVLEALAQYPGINLMDAIEANMEKLRKRYHQGTFSNEQALARADKPAGE